MKDTNKIYYEDYGVSYRQFDYWCSKGWIRAGGDGGSGHDRWFPATEISIFRIMSSLVTIGFRPERAAELARKTIDLGHNGSLELFRGRLVATGILSARGNAMSGEVTSERRTG